MKVGILGATGAVGQQMLVCLDERQIELEELRLFASSRSLGKKVEFQGKEYTIQEVSYENFLGLDYVLGAVDSPIAKQWADSIVKAGAVFIDNSKAFRLHDDVPLVVPEINGEDALQHHGIVANPNCSTIITMMAAAPLHKISKIKNIIASTYQAVSGAGVGGLRELEEETRALSENREITPSVFPAQIAFNCIPYIGSADTMNDYTSEEMKMENEGRKILHDPELNVTCTCVRVPVYRSHSISFSVQCEKPISVAQAEEAIAGFEGDVLVKNGYPMPLDTSDQDLVYVGRIREDHVLDGGLSVFCCGDQIRKGAATNAVEIMQYIDEHSYIK